MATSSPWIKRLRPCPPNRNRRCAHCDTRLVEVPVAPPGETGWRFDVGRFCSMSCSVTGHIEARGDES